MSFLLKVQRLKVHGLPPLSFDVPSGECLAVEGPSGSGKSLLLRAIADLDPAEGYVWLDGEDRCEMPAPRWRKQVRFVAAEPGWWGRTPRDHFSDPARAIKEMQPLDLPTKLMDQDISSLSTGERQRLALIRALQDDPKVILFDEPTSALDGGAAALVEGLIGALIKGGRHVLLASHDKAFRDRLADAHLILGKTGKVLPLKTMSSSGETAAPADTVGSTQKEGRAS